MEDEFYTVQVLLFLLCKTRIGILFMSCMHGCNVFLGKFVLIPFEATRKRLLPGKELLNVSM